MANAENRPFTGTWTYNNKKVRRHVPDAIITFNGETSMPSCTGCTGSIDFQDLITSVSVSNSTDTSPSSVSFGMELPTNRRSCFFRDNKFILHPGIEVHVYMRGYFTHSELGGNTDDKNYNLNKATMKPYYQVFNGVVTEVTHGYSGGFYSVSLNATDFLHFWQYQSINTNPSYLGSKVDGNKTNINFTGHAYTRKNPFSVVHELYSSGHGDAGGHSWVLSDFQNIGIKSDLFQASFWEITGYYWQKRFQQPMGNLKMYGVDGRLFNSFEQFLLSSDLIGTGSAKKNSDVWTSVGDPNTDKTHIGSIDNYMDSLLTVLRHSYSKDGEVSKQRYAFPSSSLFYVDNTTYAVDSAKKTGARGYNVAGVTAFALDISSLGQVNLFESQMQTKMDIASQVSTEIGYEFFIDFNGDYVFKPPFYNMDTSDSRIYVVKDIDLISFSASEKEAECTVMKGTGGYFNNMASLFGKEFENRGMFVDWRGVAKYGWREASFETTFLNDPRSIYYAAMNRLALANKDVQSGSCTIPLRPEMKLGFPVYIEPFDVFYYVTGISHNFSYGGDCTTDLTLTAKRAKFFPPMNKQGRFPKLGEIDFKNIYLPNHALFTKNGQGQPKYMGFPCVVLGADPNEVNPLWFGIGEITNFLVNLSANTAGKSVGGNNYEGMITLVRSLAERSKRLTYGLNPKGSERKHMVFVKDQAGKELGLRFETIKEGALILRKRIEDRRDERNWTQYEKGRDNQFIDATFVDTLKKSKKTKKYSTALTIFFEIVDEVRKEQGGFVQDGTNMENYLASLKYMKSNFRPDDQQPGMYRYYSSAFPNDETVSKTFQGMGDRQTVNVQSLETGGLIAKTVTLTHEITNPQQVVKVVDKGDGTYEIVDPNNPDHAAKVQAAGGTAAFEGRYGIPVRSFQYLDEKKGTTAKKAQYTYNVIPTESIKSMCFAVQFLGYKRPLYLDITSGVKFDSQKANYSQLLPIYTKDPHPTGILVSEVYDPFIENHLKGIRLIGANWHTILKSNGQDTRADAWKAFLDGLGAKYKKIQDGSRYAYSYSKKNRWAFKKVFWALAKAMTNDMVQLTKYFNIIEILKSSKEGKLSNFFNSSEVTVETTAQIPSGASFYGKATTSMTDILDGDIKAMDDIYYKIVYSLTLDRSEAEKHMDNPPAPNTTYEYFMLSSYDGHPLFKGLDSSRLDALDLALKNNDFSYLFDSFSSKAHSGKYVTRAAKSEPFYSPVFPVSDEAGFEVFGQYAYGRGMNLKSLAEIINTPPELWAGLSPADLNRLYGAIGSRSYKKSNGKYALTTKFNNAERINKLKDNRLENVYIQSFDTNYRTTLNDAMASYITQRGASEVLSPQLIEAMKSAGVDLTSTDEVQQHLKTWTTTGATDDVGTSNMVGMELAALIFEQAFVQNIITTNQQYGQKVAAANVPIELARLDQFYSPTSCNGGAANALSTSDAFMVESDQYSFAYSSSTGEFNETAYQQMLAENKVMDWFTHQEALRGEIQEETITLDSLAEDFEAIGDAFSTLSSDIASVPDVFGQTVLGLQPEQTAVSSLPPPTVNEEDE